MNRLDLALSLISFRNRNAVIEGLRKFDRETRAMIDSQPHKIEEINERITSQKRRLGMCLDVCLESDVEMFENLRFTMWLAAY